MVFNITFNNISVISAANWRFIGIKYILICTKLCYSAWYKYPLYHIYTRRCTWE